METELRKLAHQAAAEAARLASMSVEKDRVNEFIFAYEKVFDYVLKRLLGPSKDV